VVEQVVLPEGNGRGKNHRKSSRNLKDGVVSRALEDEVVSAVVNQHPERMHHEGSAEPRSNEQQPHRLRPQRPSSHHLQPDKQNNKQSA
jgi:hypothetical protein